MVDDSLSIIEDQRLSLDDFSGKPDELIAMLQVCQNRHGYISEEDVRQIALFIKISETHIYGVASFYAQFRFQKPGEKLIQVCMGTACHVQGGEQLSHEIQKQMGISPGQTTSDSRFDFQEIACLGCCAQAPVVEIDGKIYGKMTPEELRKVLHEEL
jgi:NADH-quinone oxidoreductase subunit E